MAATVLAERVRWEGGHSWFAECVARIRPEYVPIDPCDRLVHLPGQQVQCDLWMPGQVVPDHRGVLRSFPVLVMVAAHSRFIAAMMIPSKVTGDLLAGMWQLLSEHIGGVPRTLLFDNEAGIGQRGRLAQGVTGFCGVLGTRLIQARPYDPETKGLVERANQYLETSFLPGRVFVSAADFNDQLWQWLSTRANQRRHASTHDVPALALVADRAAMAAPPVAPVVGTTVTTRLGRDYYVNTGGNAYSVHPEMIGRIITVHTGWDQITVRCGDRLAADYQRLWGTAGLVTNPAHVAAAAVLREQYRTRPAAGRHLEVEVEVADLSAYDVVFGTGEVA